MRRREGRVTCARAPSATMTMEERQEVIRHAEAPASEVGDSTGAEAVEDLMVAAEAGLDS